uniref:Uncharacterized protein n=1 Tax=Rhizophora mucronata TaxID=61149 RepID=A0A2P2IQ48_RHIMU
MLKNMLVILSNWIEVFSLQNKYTKLHSESNT